MTHLSSAVCDMRKRMLRVVCRLRGHKKVHGFLLWAPAHAAPAEYCKRCDWWKFDREWQVVQK